VQNLIIIKDKTTADIYLDYIFYRAQWCIPAWNWRYMPLETSPKTSKTV